MSTRRRMTGSAKETRSKGFSLCRKTGDIIESGLAQRHERRRRKRRAKKKACQRKLESAKSKTAHRRRRRASKAARKTKIFCYLYVYLVEKPVIGVKKSCSQLNALWKRRVVLVTYCSVFVLFFVANNESDVSKKINEEDWLSGASVKENKCMWRK